MKLKSKILNSSLMIISILIGIVLIEIFGSFIGLGNPLLYEPDQLVGYRLRPNQSQKRRKHAKVTTDNEGFRIDPSNEIKKNSEIIVFVGDSVTYGGSYIDDKKLFSSIYCKSLKENSICLNNGINSWGTMNMGRFIENYDIYSKKIPLEIFLVILPGDEKRNFRSFSDTPFWSNPPKSPAAINEVIKFITLKYLIPKLSQSNHNDALKNNIKNSEIKSNLQMDLAWEELKVYLEKSKYPINLAITPPKKWLINPDKNLSEIKKYDDVLKKINKLSSIKKVCNLYHYAKKYEHDKTYVDGVHLSAEGHKLWAKILLNCFN